MTTQPFWETDINHVTGYKVETYSRYLEDYTKEHKLDEETE